MIIFSYFIVLLLYDNKGCFFGGVDLWYIILKQETSFLVHFTIPMHDLLDLEEFQNLSGKQYLLNFIDKYLMNKKIAVNGNN